jgi:hypothetical protein
MGTAQDNPHEQSATARAEELLERVGQQLMVFTVVARRRIQETITSARTEADRMDQPEEEKEHQPVTAEPKETAQPPPAPSERAPSAPAKAGEMVDTLGQRLGNFAALTSFQWRRTTARLREEAEDMWAEAQDIRGHVTSHEHGSGTPEQ